MARTIFDAYDRSGNYLGRVRLAGVLDALDEVWVSTEVGPVAGRRGGAGVMTGVWVDAVGFEYSLANPVDVLDAAGASIAGGVDDAHAAAQVTRALPEEVVASILRLRYDNRAGLLIRNVDINPIGPTPTQAEQKGEAGRATEFIKGVGALLGQVVGYLPESNGERVQSLYPVKGMEKAQVSTSSDVTLAFHTEAAFHPHLPRWLILLCLRGEPGVKTTTTTVSQVVAGITDEEVQVACEPRFRVGVDESYLGKRGSTFSKPRPILKSLSNGYVMNFDQDLMVGVDGRAQEVLEKIGRVSVAAEDGVCLRAGDMLIVDNHRVVHGRSPFKARYDGTDRWLLRVLVVEDADLLGPDFIDGVVMTRFVE